MKNKWIEFFSGHNKKGKKYRKIFIKKFSDNSKKKGKKVDIKKQNEWVMTQMSKVWNKLKKQK
jgi:hypothetical protein